MCERGEKSPLFSVCAVKGAEFDELEGNAEFGGEEGTCIITGEELNCYDDISTAIEFEEAYPRLLENTMIDYTKNGLGGILNDNALLSSSMAYREFSLL